VTDEETGRPHYHHGVRIVLVGECVGWCEAYKHTLAVAYSQFRERTESLFDSAVVAPFPDTLRSVTEFGENFIGMLAQFRSQQPYRSWSSG